MAHRLMRSNEVLVIFSGSGSFLVTPKRGPKEILWHVCSEQVERVGNLKFCRELCWFNRISIFPGKVGNLLFSLTRLLTIFHRFQENLMKCLNLLNRVIIEFYRFFINLASEVTRFAHPCFSWKSIGESFYRNILHDMCEWII